MGFGSTVLCQTIATPKRVGLALLGAMAGLLILVSGAQGAAPVTVSCGQTVTADTKLANDLLNCPANGLIVGADDITVDLNGNTIDGDGDGFDSCDADCDAGVDSMGHDRVTIKDGTIRDFVSGVSIEGATANRVRHLSTSDLAHGGVDVVESSDIVIKRNSSVDDGLGVSVAASSEVTVERSRVSGNEFAAIGLFESEHLLITHNSISGSGLSGIALLLGSHDSRIQENSIADGAQGIFVGDGADNNVLVGNSVSGSVGSGVSIEGASNNLIADNSLRGNDFIGMAVVNGEDNTVLGNRVDESAFGILVGGSGNRLIGNVVTDGIDQACNHELADICAGIAIESGSDNRILDNRIDRMSAGIYLRTADPEIPPVVGTVVRSNVVRGVALDALQVYSNAAESVLEDNLTVRAGDDGIDVANPSTTLAGNTANRNHDLGIEAIPGVIDGGGNAASGNGNPLQCTNVFCG